MNLFSQDIRKCRVAWSYLRVIPLNQHPSGLLEYNQAINDRIHYRVENLGEDLDELLSKVEKHCEMHLLPEYELEWLNHIDKRACYFAQKEIELLVISEDSKEFQFSRNSISDYHSALMINNLPSFEEHDTAKGKKEYFIEIIDLLNIDKKFKSNIVTAIKFIYRNNVHLCDFSWFKQNKENNLWLYNYIYDSVYYGKNPHRLDGSISNFFYSAVEIFDVWNATDDIKKMFILGLKKAYKQKLYREKSKNKEKTYAYTMSPEIGHMMNVLSAQYGQPKNKIVEYFIRNAYEACIEQQNAKEDTLF
jgi:hypothetical protein